MIEICDGCDIPYGKHQIIHIKTHTYIDKTGNEQPAAIAHLCAKCVLDRFGHLK
jgi:hypothetical protein